MFGQRLELIFRHLRHSVNHPILVSHEVKLAGVHCDTLRPQAEEAADVEDDLRLFADTMQVIDRGDLGIVAAVDGCAFDDVRTELFAGEADVFCMVHFISPLARKRDWQNAAGHADFAGAYYFFFVELAPGLPFVELLSLAPEDPLDFLPPVCGFLAICLSSHS